MKFIGLNGAHARGRDTLIDDEDADLGLFSWHVTKYDHVKRSKYIPLGKNRYTSSAIFLHRVIAERIYGEIDWESGLVVDHVNRDPLDNRRANLRVVTVAQNNFNTSARRNLFGGFKGIYTRNGRYRAYVGIGQQRIDVGTFDTADEAAWMRDQYALELHGEFAALNFEYK